MASTQNLEKAKKLTDRQERFCREYVLHLNATKAAINAGYSERSAYSIGNRMLKKDEVRNRISEMQENLAETASISKLMVLEEHRKIAFSSISHLHNTWVERKELEELTDDQKACVKSVSTKVVKRNIGTGEKPDIVDVEFVKVELWDKQKSLDSITAMLGYDAPKKQEVTGGGLIINFVSHAKR